MDYTKRDKPFDVSPDWLSFSLHLPEGSWNTHKSLSVSLHMQTNWPELMMEKVYKEYARAPYNKHYRLLCGGSVMFHDDLKHILIEITGTGCQNLHQSGDFYPIATRAINQAINITRFDIAVDFECDTDPEDFAVKRGERWKAYSINQSETGKTCYVGAPTGQKRARVYRYYDPHPRSHLLRCEMVYKKPQAKPTLERYLNSGPVETAAAMGRAFGWYHSLWSFGSVEKIKAWRPERGKASTLQWLHKQVIPALQKLHQEGILDDNHPFWAVLAEELPLVHEPPEA